MDIAGCCGGSPARQRQSIMNFKVVDALRMQGADSGERRTPRRGSEAPAPSQSEPRLPRPKELCDTMTRRRLCEDLGLCGTSDLRGSLGACAHQWREMDPLAWTAGASSAASLRLPAKSTIETIVLALPARGCPCATVEMGSPHSRTSSANACLPAAAVLVKAARRAADDRVSRVVALLRKLERWHRRWLREQCHIIAAWPPSQTTTLSVDPGGGQRAAVKPPLEGCSRDRWLDVAAGPHSQGRLAIELCQQATDIEFLVVNKLHEARRVVSSQGPTPQSWQPEQALSRRLHRPLVPALQHLAGEASLCGSESSTLLWEADDDIAEELRELRLDGRLEIGHEAGRGAVGALTVASCAAVAIINLHRHILSLVRRVSRRVLVDPRNAVFGEMLGLHHRLVPCWR